MSESDKTKSLKNELLPHREADRSWYLALIDSEAQKIAEEWHLHAVLVALKRFYVFPYQKKIADETQKAEEIRNQDGYAASDYRELLEINTKIEALKKKLDNYKCYFSEPYFARMDVVDDKEGYNSYYIGKKGDVNLEIVDWRAPLAVRYYQKSRVNFKINEYEYRTVLRRALSVKNGKLLGFKNEYLSVKEVLTPEEISGRDEEILFDPYLRSILEERKEDVRVRDIIRTIQEKQFEVVTRPERESFVLQGCAGSGKTMIMLHRLSYLIYNNEELSPRDVLVITPSDSFNAFIDELSQVLELQKVRTSTLFSFYLRLLNNEGIELSGKFSDETESERYLEFLYSDKFAREAEKDIRKIYEETYGMFTGKECREVAEKLRENCKERQALYVKVKNSSIRVRRAVLGEMKERAEGGLYFTKPIRQIMSDFTQVEDFLNFVLNEKERTPDYFFRQFIEFYRCGKEIFSRAEQVFSAAENDLANLDHVIEREIADLKRYKQNIGGMDVYTYSDRIARRIELQDEAQKISNVIAEMGKSLPLFRDFFAIIKMTEECVEMGKCESETDLARWLYRRTIKRYKKRFDMSGLFPSDAFALCFVLTAAGRQLSPHYGLVFIDEGQDLAPSEYSLLKTINKDAAFNVFGDLKQNITPWRGMLQWDESFGLHYELQRNYRNTNEIVDYVSGLIGVEMTPVGLHGEDVAFIDARMVTAYFKGRQGLKAVIAKEEYLNLFTKKGYSLLSSAGKLDKNKINVMTVYESKGLEFSAVAVYDKDMTQNEKYIACTRALKSLAIING